MMAALPFAEDVNGKHPSEAHEQEADSGRFEHKRTIGSDMEVATSDCGRRPRHSLLRLNALLKFPQALLEIRPHHPVHQQAEVS